MELRADKDKLDNEITATNTDIKEKEEKLEKLYGTSNPNEKITDLLEKSIAALRTKEGKLIDSRDRLQLAIATQPNQGKFTHCQHVVMSPDDASTIRFPNSYVVSLSKCVLSVELTLFEGLSEPKRTPFDLLRKGLLSGRVVL
jgi:septal ring factor EnvC (AmiA/AmiB activator)